ncbi:MAG: hypothetical protein JO091_01125, partial [Acidobacteriaceae bacterium]|nr:hypothetical protein [Acidobacteriaceae bacterium]
MRGYTFSRRAALKLLGALPGLARAGTANRHMFLSLNSVLVGNRVPWPDFARLAARTGFPGTDVMLAAAMEDG